MVLLPFLSQVRTLPLILKEGHDETADDAPGTLSLMNSELVTQTDPVHDSGKSFRLPPPGTPVEREYDAVAQRGEDLGGDRGEEG